MSATTCICAKNKWMLSSVVTSAAPSIPHLREASVSEKVEGETRPDMWRAMASSAAAAAMNAVFAKLGQTMSSAWNISVDPCTGVAMDGTLIVTTDNPSFNPVTKCECSTSVQNTTSSYVTKLKIYTLNVVGCIPQKLQNLTPLTSVGALNFLTRNCLRAKASYLKRPIAKTVGSWLVRGFMLFA